MSLYGKGRRHYLRPAATLNPGGIHIGIAEIYRQVGLLKEVEDCIVVGQNWKNDVRVILFVKMMERSVLTDEIIDKIKNTIRTNVSPRHVPAFILPVLDIPHIQYEKGRTSR